MKRSGEAVAAICFACGQSVAQQPDYNQALERVARRSRLLRVLVNRTLAPLMLFSQWTAPTGRTFSIRGTSVKQHSTAARLRR
jgi:hypothetical protein